MATRDTIGNIIDYESIVRIRRLEEMLGRLNMQIGRLKHSADIAVYAKSGQMPCYNPTDAIFSGTLVDIECFAEGWERCLVYLRVIGAANQDRIEKYEQKIREDKLARILKGE